MTIRLEPIPLKKFLRVLGPVLAYIGAALFAAAGLILTWGQA